MVKKEGADTGDRQGKFRGFLTETDRKYLLDKGQLEGQAERNRRKYIRERVKNALLDFTLLQDHLEKRDRRLVVKDLSTDSFDGSRARRTAVRRRGSEPIANGIASSISFLYLATQDVGIPFDRVLRHALMEVVEEPIVGLEFEVITDEDAVAEAAKKMVAGEPLSGAEARAAITRLREQSDVDLSIG